MAKAEAAEKPLLHTQPQYQPQSQGYYGIPAPAPIQEPLFDQPYILLPLYRRLRRRRRRGDGSGGFSRCCDALLTSSALLVLVVSLLVLGLAAFFVWPSDPQLSIVRLSLDHVRVITDPAPSLDIALDLKVRIRNPDFFSLDYRSIVVTIGYRGKPLGFVSSDGGHVRARGVSYMNAKLRLNGIQIIHDAFYLIEDLARGSIPFDTLTEVQGQLHLFFFDLPTQGRKSCSVHVNPATQTVVRQECYIE